MYRDYFLRSVPSLWPTLLQLGAQLGAVKLKYAEFSESTDENGITISTPTGDPIVTAIDGEWDYIGEIMLPTGQTQIINGLTVPVVEPIRNGEGVVYLHANLRTNIDLRQVAETMAADNPELAAALSGLDQFFVTDAEGNAVAPNLPHRVWA